MTAYKNASVQLDGDCSLVRPDTGIPYTTLYTVNKNKSIKVAIEGPFHKVGVVFNPLGINHFFDSPLSSFFKQEKGEFPFFGSSFYSCLETVFREVTIENKVSQLDQFFESALIPFDETVLKKAVGAIILSNGSLKVEELSDTLQVNRKTLLRLFQKHVLMSVEDYRKMVMFRQAMNYYQEHKSQSNLTEVALFSMYYDQAHFIKHFKSVTKETPSSLLTKVAQVGTEDTYWYFE